MKHKQSFNLRNIGIVLNKKKKIHKINNYYVKLVNNYKKLNK